MRGGEKSVAGRKGLLSVTLRFPGLEREAIVERRCKSCGGFKVYRHGRPKRAVRDIWVKEVEGRRMRCLSCGKTFTYWPEGQTAGRRRTDRAVLCGVVLYSYGASYPKVVAFMGGLGVKESVGTVYGDVIRAGKQARRRNQGMVKEAKVIGLDGTGQRLKGQGVVGVMVAVDLEKGFLLELKLADEEDPEEVKRFIKGLLKGHKGVEVIVTDEHRNYEGLETATGIRHSRCRSHYLRAKLRRLRRLGEELQRKGWKRRLKELEGLDPLLRAGPKEGLRAKLLELYQRYLRYKSPGTGKRYGLGYRLKLLIQELLDKLEEVGEFTNNTTERIIGLALKFRSKVMRGFKKKENISLIAELLFWLWLNRTDCQLSYLI